MDRLYHHRQHHEPKAPKRTSFRDLQHEAVVLMARNRVGEEHLWAVREREKARKQLPGYTLYERVVQARRAAA